MCLYVKSGHTWPQTGNTIIQESDRLGLSVFQGPSLSSFDYKAVYYTGRNLVLLFPSALYYNTGTNKLLAQLKAYMCDFVLPVLWSVYHQSVAPLQEAQHHIYKHKCKC